MKQQFWDWFLAKSIIKQQQFTVFCQLLQHTVSTHQSGGDIVRGELKKISIFSVKQKILSIIAAIVDPFCMSSTVYQNLFMVSCHKNTFISSMKKIESLICINFWFAFSVLPSQNLLINIFYQKSNVEQFWKVRAGKS